MVKIMHGWANTGHQKQQFAGVEDATEAKQVAACTAFGEYEMRDHV